MKYLRDFITRSPSLAELDFSFSDSLLNGHTIDTSVPSSQRALVTEFCGVIRAMVTNHATPVVVIKDGFIYRARPGDLADWGFRHFSYGRHAFRHVAWIDKTWSVLKGEDNHPYLFLPVRVGMGYTSWYTTDLRSVNVRVRPTGPEAVTIITLEKKTQMSLELGPSPSIRDGTIPGSQLRSVIPLISLPALRNLHINEDVDPTVLHQFLLSHPTIHSIRYGVKAREGYPPAERSTDSPCLITSSPLLLPSLTSLVCVAAHIIPPLDTFGLSPRLSWLGVEFNRQTAQLPSLKRSLRRLCLHTISTCLYISVDEAGDPLIIEDEERKIVGCLYGTVGVRISSRDMTGVKTPIPWLGMLPALRRLELLISSWRWGAHDSATASALAEVRAELPWVPDVEILP
ncbi:hypothetical protein FB451DRAFT_1391810 [Mycena latifolia]|nr:hypothetical protein FB451DRAFT_1391810 [Mycena latifolia]